MTKKEWYEDLSDENIEWLKENEKPFGLLSIGQQSLMKRVPPEDTEIYTPSRWRCRIQQSSRLYKGNTYRLRPDWQRPEKKEGHWEYGEVFEKDGKWWYQKPEGFCNYSFNRVDNYVGFGGVEFKELERWWSMEISMFYDHEQHKLVSLDAEDIVAGFKPATPHRVRFWVEGKE